MAAILESHPGTDSAAFAAVAWIALTLVLSGAVGGLQAAEPAPAAFAPVYALLQTHCGACHVQGVADGPWSLNTPPSTERFPVCLDLPAAAALECATYHELVDSPGPGIPAWIRPAEAGASEPYVQACDPEASFHIGHSLPEKLSDEACGRFLRWIEAGAPSGASY